MKPTVEPAVGIDLGTTYSAIATLDDTGRPRTLANAEGDKVTPSAILFDGDEIVVGKEALKAIATDMLNVVECPKRQLGQRLFRKPVGGRQYPPEVLEAVILNKLRCDARSHVGELHKVVVTVPAYFDEIRRKATQDAGYMAGFEVMDIINEPTAAAVAFGFEHGYMKPSGEAPPQKILVYDLGGGTFDVTVMDIQGADFVALATDGDVQLGGRDWDQRLVDYVAEDFIRRFGVDPREDPCTHGRLWRECEDAKRTLSARSKAVVACDFEGHAVRLEITRDEFQDMTRDLLDRTKFTVRQTLEAAGLGWNDVDRILLVGGSTRMPAVGDALRELSGKEPDRSISPDEAVAHGAALHAGLLLSRYHGHPPTFRIKNVNSHSLGVVATDARTNRKRNAIVIPRNTPLPVTARRVFKTERDGQRSIRVEIVEGESPSPDDCSQIGRCSVSDLPKKLAAKTPIEVRFRYQENGRLTVTVRVSGAGQKLAHEIIRENTISREQLDQWRMFVSGVGPGPIHDSASDGELPDADAPDPAAAPSQPS